MKSIRVLLALAAKKRMAVHQMDVKTAFLNADVDRDLYMSPPPNAPLPTDKQDYVWKLKKSLYGLKQASKLWGEHLASTLLSMGFVRSSADNCIWTRLRHGEYTYIGCYVDDLIITGTDTQQMNDVKSHFSTIYTMKDLGLMEWCLGMRFTQHPDGRISIDQSLAIQQLDSDGNIIRYKARLAARGDRQKEYIHYDDTYIIFGLLSVKYATFSLEANAYFTFFADIKEAKFVSPR